MGFVKKQKVPPFPTVDPNSPESKARGKAAEEFLERMARSETEEQIRAEQYHRTHPYNSGSVSNQGSENYYRSGNTKWDDPNYRSSASHQDVFSSAASTAITQTKWVFQDWLPENESSMLAGPPNCGKTTIALAMGAAISQGSGHPLWQGLYPLGSGHVTMSSREDDFSSTILLRFKAAGGDDNRFHNLNGIPAFHPTIPYFKRPCNFSNEDCQILTEEAKRIGNIGLMIFDPASQVSRGDSSNNTKARAGSEQLKQFAASLTCAVLGITHTLKSVKGKGLYARLAGPGAIGQVARSIIMACEIKDGPLDDGATHVLVLAKSFGKPVNYGPTYSIQSVTVTDQYGDIFPTSKVVWHGLIEGTAEEIIKWAESDKVVAGAVDKLQVAVNFLKELLCNGHVLRNEVYRLMKEAGITTRDRDDAKKILGVIPYKQSGAGQNSSWLWRLPD